MYHIKALCIYFSFDLIHSYFSEITYKLTVILCVMALNNKYLVIRTSKQELLTLYKQYESIEYT